MTPTELDEIEARAAAATEYGPSRVVKCSCGHEACNKFWVDNSPLSYVNLKLADAEFYAAVRTDVPKLVARVRELEAALKEAYFWESEP